MGLRDFKSSGVFIFIRKDLVRHKGGTYSTLEIKVYGNDIEKALKILKRQLQKEALFKEVKKRSFYEKPSEKKKRKKIKARKKRMKALRLKPLVSKKPQDKK